MNAASFNLTGRRALVTGSARGLGRSYIDALAFAGASVVVNDLDADAVDLVVDELRSKGHDAEGIVFNVTDGESVRREIAAFEKSGKAIDVLVNNAGIHRYAALAEMKESQWSEVIGVNLTGPFLVAQAVAEGMIRREKGKVINVCSLMSEATRPTTGNYTAAKGGLKMLTKSMAVEWGRHGIQANGLGPGYILTPMTEHLAKREDFDTWVKNRTPLGRWGLPEDLAGPVVFLASAASDFVNGHVLYVDGGWLAGL